MKAPGALKMREKRREAGVVRYTMTLDLRPLGAALAGMAAAAKRAVEAMTAAFAKTGLEPEPIPLHGFTPNFDLVCQACGVGPEECRGGRG